MEVAMRVVVRDVLAGALLVNAVPHSVMGVAGKRCLTPLGGEDSSPVLNLVWAGMNVAGAVALLASGRWGAIGQREASERLVSVEIGGFAMTAFGMVYELTAGRRKRAARAAGDRDGS